MNINRRTFFKAGGAVVAAAAAGGVIRTVDQGVLSVGQGPAYAPWSDWRAASTSAERIVRAGLLAANPHNSQPWHFLIRGQAIDLFADYSRQIGVIDPLRREMHIGLGCAIENMRLAALAEGFSAAISLLPDPAYLDHVAHLELTAAPAQVTDLYIAIPERHTNRGPYDLSRPVGKDALDALAVLSDDDQLRVFWFTDQAARDPFARVALAAAQALIADQGQSIDSHNWWRQSWPDIQAHRDGITLDAQAFDELTTVAAKILPDVTREQGDAVFVQNVRDVYLPTASAFGLIAARDPHDHAQRMGCGRLWQRMQLWATTQGIAMQPLNQMCERADREFQKGLDPVFGRALRGLTGSDEWTGIMPFRVGYPTRTARLSPRRSFDEVQL